jgi:hypothetical protein
MHGRPAMDADSILKAIESETKDQAQRERIEGLAKRIQIAFSAERSKGVEGELDKDWQRLKAEFDAELRQVKKLTGLY